MVRYYYHHHYATTTPYLGATINPIHTQLSQSAQKSLWPIEPHIHINMKYQALLVYLILLFIVSNAEDAKGSTPEEEGSDNDNKEDDCFYCHVSPECAAVLAATGGGAGAGMTCVVGPMLRLLGFTATGVAGGSFAAYWQSMLPLIKAGSLFATLQSIAMSGVGAKVAIVSTIAGAYTLSKNINLVCEKVDAVEKDSYPGQLIQALLKMFRQGAQAADSAWKGTKTLFNDLKKSYYEEGKEDL